MSDLIIEGAKGIPDGLYVIKDGEMFKYKPNRSTVCTVRSYHITDRLKGEWIDTGNDKEHLHPLSARWYRCSVCGLETNAKTNYCFDCGADMRSE